MVDADLLRAVGQTRGRYYVAGDMLRGLYREVRSARPPVDDPFPTVMDEIRSAGRATTT